MVSVIVPVYNCEKYLDSSINSLINQTIFNQLEIIFVNDGSSDSSEEILQRFANKYSNMKLITQTNKGVSEARNIGIKHSKGDYVCFFDADDIAKPTLYEKLMSLITFYNVDLAIVDYSMVFSDGIEKKHRSCVKRLFADNQEIMKEFFVGSLICANPVDKIFKRDIINGITFPKGFSIGEDMYFVYQVLNRIDKLFVDSSESLYHYCLRSNSAMKKEFSNKHIDSVRLARMILDDFDVMDVNYKYAEANYIHEICKMLALYINSGSTATYAEEVKKYRDLLNNYKLSKAIKILDIKHFIALFLMRYFPNQYLLAYKYFKVG